MQAQQLLTLFLRNLIETRGINNIMGEEFYISDFNDIFTNQNIPLYPDIRIIFDINNNIYEGYLEPVVLGYFRFGFNPNNLDNLQINTNDWGKLSQILQVDPIQLSDILEQHNYSDSLKPGSSLVYVSTDRDVLENDLFFSTNDIHVTYLIKGGMNNSGVIINTDPKYLNNLLKGDENWDMVLATPDDAVRLVKKNKFIGVYSQREYPNGTTLRTALESWNQLTVIAEEGLINVYDTFIEFLQDLPYP